MRIVHDYSLKIKREDGKIVVLCIQEHLCEGCSRPMKCKDRRERIGRTYDGEKRIYLVRRMYCRECRRMHTELPDFLLKYKHYEAQIIEDGIEDQIPDWHTNPVPETIRRWKIWFSLILPFLNAALDSIYTELEEQLPSFFRQISYVEQIRKKGEGWLAAILDILINTNRYPEPRILTG